MLGYLEICLSTTDHMQSERVEVWCLYPSRRHYVVAEAGEMVVAAGVEQSRVDRCGWVVDLRFHHAGRFEERVVR